MNLTPRRRTPPTGPKKAVTKPRVARARAALLSATDSKGWVKAAFRLMLATAPSAFASAALRCSSSDAALWISSNGFRVHSAEMPAMMVGHPGILHLMTNPGLKVLPTRGVLPPQEVLETMPFYQAFMVPSGWRHAVGLCFWKPGNPPKLDCVISVHRTAEEGDFADEEIARLGALHAEIDAARERVTALEDERAARSSFEHFVRSLPVPVALLNWEMIPVYQNDLAQEARALWVTGAAAHQHKVVRDSVELPGEIIAACRELQTEWRERIRVDSQRESVLSRTIRRDNPPYIKATVRLLFLTGSTLGDPNFMIEFEPPRQEADDKQANLSALLGLTPAERLVVLQAGALKSNAEIAETIGRSVGTVKAELHAAYKKLGVRTRSELVSLLRA